MQVKKTTIQYFVYDKLDMKVCENTQLQIIQGKIKKIERGYSFSHITIRNINLIIIILSTHITHHTSHITHHTSHYKHTTYKWGERGM